MTDFIRAAGGENIGADKIPGAIGQLNLEYVLARAPDFYLAGGGTTVVLNGLRLGPTVTLPDARKSLDATLTTPGLSALSAIKRGNAAAIWLFFFDIPLFVVGVEQMAKFFHPHELSDIDPNETLAELNNRFLPFKLDGTYWARSTTP
jgi:iron complex transport system substrate-binding protein